MSPFLDCSKENSERKCVEDGTLLREEEVRVHYQFTVTIKIRNRSVRVKTTNRKFPRIMNSAPGLIFIKSVRNEACILRSSHTDGFTGRERVCWQSFS